jgi:hypothetical protein
VWTIKKKLWIWLQKVLHLSTRNILQDDIRFNSVAYQNFRYSPSRRVYPYYQHSINPVYTATLASRVPEAKMLARSLLTILAASASLVAANAEVEGEETTTTMTSTMTMTVTITKCNPSKTDCPLYTANSTSAYFPLHNSTSTSGPTATKSSKHTEITETSVAVIDSPAATTTRPAVGAAGSVFVQGGMLAAALGVAGLALL